MSAADAVVTRDPGTPVGGRPHRIGPRARALLVVEVCLVLALSLGQSAVYAVVNLVAAATAPGPLASHQAVMNGSLAPGRENLDLVLQVLAIGFGLVPAALAGYLLVRGGTSLTSIWYAKGTLVRDGGRG